MRSSIGIFFTFIAATAAAVADPVVTVKNGSYVGVYNQQYNQDFFLSVPFAQVGVTDDVELYRDTDTFLLASKALQPGAVVEHEMEWHASLDGV